MHVVGPNLLLRPPRPDDAPALFALGRDPEVTRWFSWGPYEREDEATAYIRRATARAEAGEHLDLVVVHLVHGPVGITGLGEFSRRDRRAVVGTWFGRAHWGTGLNAESKALVGRLAFDGLGLGRLSAYADVANARSQRALEKTGFTREGVLREWHRHGEDAKDVAFYRLLRSEFLAGPLAAIACELRGEPPAAFVAR